MCKPEALGQFLADEVAALPGRRIFCTDKDTGLINLAIGVGPSPEKTPVARNIIWFNSGEL